jgi:hypothetical protein
MPGFLFFNFWEDGLYGLYGLNGHNGQMLRLLKRDRPPLDHFCGCVILTHSN